MNQAGQADDDRGSADPLLTLLLVLSDTSTVILVLQGAIYAQP